MLHFDNTKIQYIYNVQNFKAFFGICFKKQLMKGVNYNKEPRERMMIMIINSPI